MPDDGQGHVNRHHQALSDQTQIFLNGLDVVSQGCEAGVWLLISLVGHMCDPACACSCYIQVYNKFYKGGIFFIQTILLGLFFECLSPVDLAWMHMQPKHKAKPSHNYTYIPQLCNSLPPRYWVFVVISRF